VALGANPRRGRHIRPPDQVQVTPHAKRSNRKGNTGPDPVTACFASRPTCSIVPAEIIALLYQHRFTIELFFRFFKHLPGLPAPARINPKGFRIQVYSAIIAWHAAELVDEPQTDQKPTLEIFFTTTFTGLPKRTNWRITPAKTNSRRP